VNQTKYLESIGGYLTQNGFSIIKVKKGKQAFQFALKIDPDLCILDSQLTDVNGFAVCRSIRKKRPDLPVIVCSSIYKGAENLKKAKQKFLATDLIEKPCSEAIMLERINGILSGSQEPKKSVVKPHSLEDKLEQTLSGLDLSSMAPKKKKKTESSPSATIQVNTAELKRELNKLRTGKASSQAYRGTPQFKVGSAGKKPTGQHKLSSKDIFGDLISDIEKGVKKKKVTPPIEPKPVVEKVAPPPPSARDLRAVEKKVEQAKGSVSDAPPEPGSYPPPDTGFLLEDPSIDALPGFGESDKSEPEPSDSKANDYELIEKIAAGGMAEVWKARLKGEKGFEKIVAIKKILPHLSDNEEFITMFIDEAKVAANLTHPNIAQIYELGKFGDTFFIAMEYVSGRNLRTILNYCKSVNVLIPPSIAVFIGVKLCNALEYAHRKKDHTKNEPLHIVHRDISPQNILISVEGEIKLVDFGIAKATIKAANTVAGSLKGKLLYMSPEQAEGKAIDNRSDIFSLGNLLYESLTGSRLVDGDSELSILKKVREADFKNPRELNSQIPVKLEQILLKALKKNPNDRFNTARDLEKELKNYMKIEKLHVTESDVVDFMKHVDEKDQKKINEFELTRSQAGKESVIMPDNSEVRKFEKESLVGIGSKKRIPWVWAAVIGIPLLAILSYIAFKFIRAESPEPVSANQVEMQTEVPVKEQSTPSAIESSNEPERIEDALTEQETDDPITSGQPATVENVPGNNDEMTETNLSTKKGGGVDDEVVEQPVVELESEKPVNAGLTDVATPVQTDKTDPATIPKDPEAENQPTSEQPSDESSLEEMLEQMKALQAERAKKQRKLQEFKKANNLAEKEKKKKNK